MKVNVTATYSWTEEVTDDDLMQIIEDEGWETPKEGEEDSQLAEAYERWQDERENALESDPVNIPEDATCNVLCEVIK